MVSQEGLVINTCLLFRSDLLQMSELPSNLPNKVIDFNEYLEIVIDPNYGLVCINC